MCFAILGSISVKLMPRLNIDQGKFGSLISVFMFSCLVASLVVGVVSDMVGYRAVAIFGFVVTALCFFLFARAKNYGLMMLACLILGAGAMALNTAGNVLGVQVLFGGQNPAQASNLCNVFFGLGLFVTPLIVSFLFRKVSYEAAVSVLAVIVLVPIVLALLATFPASKAGFQIGDAVALLKEPVVLVAAFMLFCYISLEISFCNWIPPYGKEVITAARPDADAGVVDASAQRMLSVFAITMMIGRFVASQIPAVSTHGSYVIAGAAFAATIIIFIMTVSKDTSMAWVLAALSGLAFAPCFPTTVGTTFSQFDKSIHGSVFGIIFAVGLAGAVIVPKAIGNLAKGSSVQKGLKLLIPAGAVLIILAIVLAQLVKAAS